MEEAAALASAAPATIVRLLLRRGDMLEINEDGGDNRRRRFPTKKKETHILGCFIKNMYVRPGTRFTLPNVYVNFNK